ncbi:hypothetical protein AB0383_20515 [Amycolatopsis sp. NPDC051373]|uniref:hypothetical protein n=1 Tax=Amycolatopsis sp. NPDC051373 TaxID=3155801 RepID=UPI00344FDB80
MGIFGIKTYYFHNDRKMHSWDWTGEVKNDGWPLAGVRCSICGEERMIGVDKDNIGLRYGCVRVAMRDRYEWRDLIVIDSGRLDRIEKALGGGYWLTSNLGGGRYRVHESEFRRFVAADR